MGAFADKGGFCELSMGFAGKLLGGGEGGKTVGSVGVAVLCGL